MCVSITCPDEVADVVANDDSAGGCMARAEALATINVACGAVGIGRHTQLGKSTVPVSIGFALLEEVWAQSAGRHLSGFGEAFNSGKSTDGVHQKVHGCGHCIGDVPVLNPVDAELKGKQRDAQQDERDQDCCCCWHCVATTGVADGGIVQDCIQHRLVGSAFRSLL